MHRAPTPLLFSSACSVTRPLAAANRRSLTSYLSHALSPLSTTPSPSPLRYTCNTTSFQCVESADSGNDQGSCDAACSDETPSALVGLWRGLSVNGGFDLKEHVFNFSTNSVRLAVRLMWMARLVSKGERSQDGGTLLHQHVCHGCLST